MIRGKVGHRGSGLESNSVKPSGLEDAAGGIIEDVVLEGHNHMSPILALSTGCEKFEKWGENIVEWVRKLSGPIDLEKSDVQ